MSSCMRMWVKKASKSTFGWSAGARATFEMGRSTVVELRPLRVLQHHALAALLGDDPLVVRAGCRPRSGRPLLPWPEEKTTSTTRIGAMPAELRVAEGGVDRQPVLEPLQLRGEAGELRRLLLVAHGDERLEGRLVAEPAVVVGLVGPDRGLERRVELHPGDVARVVVVGEEGRRALLEEGPQRRLRRSRPRPRAAAPPPARARPGTRRCRARRVSVPAGVRRIVVKKPVAAARSASGRAFIHASTSAFVAPAG